MAKTIGELGPRWSFGFKLLTLIQPLLLLAVTVTGKIIWNLHDEISDMHARVVLLEAFKEQGNRWTETDDLKAQIKLYEYVDLKLIQSTDQLGKRIQVIEERLAMHTAEIKSMHDKLQKR